MPLLILLLITIHGLMLAILIRHRRNVRHHRFTMGVIGSDPQLTQTLHDRMLRRQPQADWLNPHVMRAKLTAWRNREQRTGNRKL